MIDDCSQSRGDSLLDSDGHQVEVVNSKASRIPPGKAIPFFSRLPWHGDSRMYVKIPLDWPIVHCKTKFWEEVQRSYLAKAYPDDLLPCSMSRAQPLRWVTVISTIISRHPLMKYRSTYSTLTGRALAYYNTLPATTGLICRALCSHQSREIDLRDLRLLTTDKISVMALLCFHVAPVFLQTNSYCSRLPSWSLTSLMAIAT